MINAFHMADYSTLKNFEINIENFSGIFVYIKVVTYIHLSKLLT